MVEWLADLVMGVCVNSRFLPHYDLLGIKPGDNWPTLRAAYRAKIASWHPDRFEGLPEQRRQAEERTKAINAAYKELADYYRISGRLPLDVEPMPDELLAAAPRESDAPPRSTGASHFHYWTSSLFRLVSVAGFVVAAYLLATLPNNPAGDQDPELVEEGPRHILVPADTRPTSADEARDRFFTKGSSVDDVLTAQGVPSSAEDGVWRYGTSTVHFANGMVVHWQETPGYPLRAKAELPPTRRNPEFFTKGSTKTEVREIQGDPVHETDRMWDYGVSRVYFERGRVVGWYESPLHPLKLKRELH